MTRSSDKRTLDLFDAVPAAPALVEGGLAFDAELRAALVQALKETPLSRYQVAARMSELLATDVSKNQIDAWTAESREGWRFPLVYAPAFEAACETYALIDLFARKRGCRVAHGKDALLAELGRLEQLEHELRQKRRRLKDLLRDDR